MNKSTQRRLAAIVSADVVGYSRLMGVDEVGTLAALRLHRTELIDAKIAEHGGRVVKTMGDGLLLEFPSVVDATTCSIEVQEGMATRNEDVAEDKRITFRIGVHVGDIIIEGEDILGDDVNIASRIEALAEPGGVSNSHRAYEDVRDRLETGFVDTGEQNLKNIARPVRVWRWLPSASQANAPATTNTATGISDKPSIAVLPFTNMSGDPEQEYFSDGITEDIITALASIRQLFVMARNTTFTYKGQAVDIRAVARELGVHYVLEGSVRRAGNRVRITVQLINGATGDHLWAERYDRDMADIFAVQDEITQIVAGAIEPEITKAEFERQRHAPPENLDAWQLYQRGVYHFHRLEPEDEGKARTFLQASIEKDPSFSPAYATLARSYSRGAFRGLVDNPEEGFGKALEAAKSAISLDRDDAHAQAAMGFASLHSSSRTSVQSFEVALALNPNYAGAHFGIGMALLGAGRPTNAMKHLATAIQLSPRDPLMPLYRSLLGSAYFALGDDEVAVDFLAAVRSEVQPAGRRTAVYIAVLAHLGREDEMREEAKRYLAAIPHATISLILKHTTDLGGRLADGLRKAGLPEE